MKLKIYDVSEMKWVDEEHSYFWIYTNHFDEPIKMTVGEIARDLRCSLQDIRQNFKEAFDLGKRTYWINFEVKME